MTNFKEPISETPLTEKEQFKYEIDEYERLLGQLKDVDGLEQATRRAGTDLAFLIEEMKQKNPEEWRNDIQELKGRIGQTAKEGMADVTWLMTEVIGSAYIEFLERRKSEVQDESLKRKLEIIKKMTEDSIEFNRKAHKNGQSVAFVGVSLDYVPKWYYHVTK